MSATERQLRAVIRMLRPLAECNAAEDEGCQRIACQISAQDYDAPELLACTEHAHVYRRWNRWRMGEQLASMLEGVGE